MNTRSLLHGLRFIDSFFPLGGYAYSSGLEAAVQAGVVRNAEDLARYVEDILRGSLGSREVVAVGLALQAAGQGTLGAAVDVDQELEAMKTSRESRLASRQMGRQMIRIASEHAEGQPVLRDFHVAVEAGRTPGHLPVSLGLTLGAYGWNRVDAQGAYLYHSAAGLVSASLKLLPIGQREAQRLLMDVTPLIDELSGAAERRTVLVAWSPVQEICAMRHSRLPSRLFRS
jgi:urease accessory protein